jgi:transposase-like protein
MSESDTEPHVEPYKSAEKLSELYHEQGLSQSEIGDKFGIDQSTVSYWMEKLDVESRPRNGERDCDNGVTRVLRDDFRVQYRIDNHGGFGENKTVWIYENNVVALEDNHPAVVGEAEVDHLLQSPLKLNFIENLQPRLAEEHQQRHKPENSATPPVKMLNWVFGSTEGDEQMSFDEVLTWFKEWGRMVESNNHSKGREAGVSSD